MTRSVVRKLAEQGIQQLRQVPIKNFDAVRRQKASFWRGGTSNGVMIAGNTLPEWRTIRERYPDCKLDLKDCAEILQPVYQAIFGSPDPYGRQLNGMGGGLSSLSKAVIVDRSSSPDFDLDYLFIQIGIKDGKLDLAGNCGNMTSAVAPFALEEAHLCSDDKLSLDNSNFKRVKTSTGNRLIHPILFRLRNLNTNRSILAEIQGSYAIDDSEADCLLRFEERGDYALDGVPGFASPITLSFLSPGGAKTGKALPTSNPVDTLEYEPGSHIRASLSDISNPGVFIDGREVGWDHALKPEELNANTALMQKLEAIRRRGASMMGLDPDTPSIPKVVMLFPPASPDVDITCHALSMEQAHKAAPMTLGLNLGVACKMQGTIAHELARHRDPRKTVIGHPSGRVEVGADISPEGKIVSAKVIRTARCLMEGFVNVTRNEEVSVEG